MAGSPRAAISHRGASDPRRSSSTSREKGGRRVADSIDADTGRTGVGAEEDASSHRGVIHRLPLQPLPRTHPKPVDPPVSDADKMVAHQRERRRSDLSRSGTGSDVALLAEALRAAKHAYAAYTGELRQADTDPFDDWSVWYAEYLLGVR